MRMRKKKNLDERLEQVSDNLLICKNDSLNHNDAVNEKHYLDFYDIFNNNNPVCLEIGCGKGGFACDFAQAHPELNILCVEKARNVVVAACETAKMRGLDNIYFLCGGAEYLPSFIPANSIEMLFLNFSCPFPKKKYASHRLTHQRFLDIYKLFLKKGAPICQKTDNMHLFEFSIEQFSACGFKISNISLDLHNSDYEDNIMTEYENKFSLMGKPIYRLEARFMD